MKSQLDRIRVDVRCGGKMGKASSLRLLDLLEEMIQRIEHVERRTIDTRER